MARDQCRFGRKRHGIDDEPTAGGKRRNGSVEQTRPVGTAADKDRVRSWQV